MKKFALVSGVVALVGMAVLIVVDRMDAAAARAVETTKALEELRRQMLFDSVVDYNERVFGFVL